MADSAEPTPDDVKSSTVPDYLASPDAVFKDEGVKWRYGEPPDYSKTRKYWQQSKKSDHAAGSLPEMVENLVKNWEVEASFKPRLQDWRTIDHANYTFSMNGGPPQTAEHMLNVGTYNAIIATPNEYYSPANSDFAASHKTFKRMMPSFAWEVLEVYSGPPTVAFRWRHWGDMKSDYVSVNEKGEKVTAKAHGGLIEIFGVTVAKVDEKIRIQSVETWMDPMALFRQIAPDGVVAKHEAVLENGHDQSEADKHALNGLHNGNSITPTEERLKCPFLVSPNGKHNDTSQQASSPVSPPPETPLRPQRSSKRSGLTPQGKRKSSIGTKHAASSSADEAEKTNGRKRLKMELATEVSAVKLGDAKMGGAHAVEETDGDAEHSRAA